MTVDALARALYAASSSEGAATASRAQVADVYDVHADYVWRCLRSLGVRDAVLEDAVQDVFLVVHQKLGAFDGRAQLRTWLYAIVLRVARKQRERQKRAMDPLAEEPSDDRFEGAVLSRDELAFAHAALSALDEKKREVFVLAEIEQLTVPEIAEIVGEPLNTVYSRLRAARSAFEHEVTERTRPGRSRP